jgi:hypothetical protein
VATMKGFHWLTSAPDGPWLGPGDRWCVRDAFSALLRWPVGSDEWGAFIEAPGPEDMDRLTAHLGLEWFDPDYGPHAEQLAERLDHPGIACWKLHAVQLGHVLYQPHLRFPRQLPIQYWEFTPELFRIIVDPRQAPHSV